MTKICRRKWNLSFRASRRRVEKSIFKQISPQHDASHRFGRNDVESFLQSNLKSQIVISSWGGMRRSLPYAFTEQGVVMLSSVLRSKQAIGVNIAIMRTFVKLREILAHNELLRRKIESLERKYDEQFQHVFNVLAEMVISESKPKTRIGYLTEAQGHEKFEKRTKAKAKR